MLLEYAKKNHFPNPVFFVDDGCSGTNCDRPGFQRMLTEIEAEYRKNYREKSL
ncbi:MAG: recombinase family protein [Subdoligranulum sp.]